MKTLAGVVALVTVVALHAGAASAGEMRTPDPTSGVVLRNSLRLSQRTLALGPVSDKSALTARLEWGPIGTGAALGIMKVDGSSHVPALEHVGVELEAVRGYGPTSLSPTTFVGPQLAMGSYYRRLTVGWLVDVENPDDNHAQVGVGLGF
jgi:hypothetical protein